MSQTQSAKQQKDAMPKDEEEDDDEEENLAPEDGAGDAKQKKKPRKKKKKSKPQDGDEVFEDICADPRNGLYWPAPEAVPVGDSPPGKDEEWVDITTLCDLAVNGMNVGEMVESSTFRLYDAMSAIEIMDPKMDTGFRSNEDMSLEKALTSGLVGKVLEEKVLAGVIDHLLMYYLLWLDGHTIIQTCFSCLYLQDPKRLLAPLPELASFVDALLIVCQHAQNAVTAAGVFDDEDFVPTMFGVDLQACVFSSDPQKVSNRLRKECDRLRAEKGDLVACRLEFMEQYMLAVVSLTGPNKGEAATAHLDKSLQLLQRMEANAEPPSDEVLQRFDASTNRKLLVPGPPRTVEPIKDPKVAFKMWTCHVQELTACTSLLDRSLNQLLQGVVVHKDESPNVLVRSIAQLTVAAPGFVRRLLLESLETHLFPPEALQHCKRLADPFINRCESMFLHLMKLAHLNTTRRFRRLAHVFPDFNELQHEAWRLDEALKATFAANLRYNRPSWAWIQEFTLQAMVSKLLLGFQLELYDEAEFHMIYWYVDYLLGLRIYNLNEVFHSKEATAGGGKKKSHPRPKDALGKLKPRNPPTSLLLLEATQSLVRGLFRALAFCCHGLLSSPPAVEAGLCQRFVLRFRSLEQFRLPHLPSFEDFKQSAVLAQDCAERRSVLQASQNSFLEATQLLDRVQPALKEESAECAGLAQSLRRVVVANQLGVTQLLRCLDSGAEELARKRVTAELVHHKQFVSLQVVDK
ncbi:N-alpha-acetyltransferase 35, NatC auxiliary subunit [Symbiodinium microadriaticum]|uniref:N-alpha-acetyltransferase 35, NatC auxiliary subunit n=1 Tax=Symbiodinium microadriaticum TaxID=2951 RepID=A0A1Q9CRF0_SYMMI|nr:N-alpha-acetyltransferase 35, NatC auxiliary subunit [Symbiodinium microadriaticum]